MEALGGLLVLFAIAAFAYFVFRVGGHVWSKPQGIFQRVTVYDWERGLIYNGGRFDRDAPAGAYWLGPTQTLIRLPAAAQTAEISAQEVLTADRLQVKLSAVVVYRILDPRKAMETSGAVTTGDFTLHYPPVQQALYRDAQLALRAIASARSLEALLDQRDTLSEALRAQLQPTADQHGMAIESAAVRDIILATDIRRLYAETERARLEGLAALERARGEQAALRSLANSARMLKNNPELMNLRLLQTVDARSGKANTTIVLGEGSLAALTRGGAAVSEAEEGRDSAV